MSAYPSLTRLLETIQSSGASKHKTARALRFVYRHRKAHRGLIHDLDAAARKHVAERIVARHNQRLSADRAPIAGKAPIKPPLARFNWTAR